MNEEYISRINRVIDFIENNLDQELPLQKLATVANFSPFHFHRIFKAMLGETLNQFVQRLRIEKASSLLLLHPEKNITRIAFDCGFSSSAAFARSFKEYFGISASEYKSTYSKISKTESNLSKYDSKMRQDMYEFSTYIDNQTNQYIWRIHMPTIKEATIEVKKQPQKHVAYVRHIGPYKGDGALFGKLSSKLMRWAGPRGLLQFPKTEMLNVYHDDPNVTSEENLRLSVCITVPEATKVDGEIGMMILSAGDYAMARFEIKEDQFEEAWQMVMGKWLPQSGYQPDDKPCYELCHNDPNEHPENVHIVDICVPVKPL